ncbi:MAG TPA: transcription antitermination factor NusB, partial [Xanthobacteraceae bacterium]|nr:transcription antitermination factor NusB [Xanthobacteraceae bacterium]
MARSDLAVDVPGFPARRIAAEILESVLQRRRPLDNELERWAALPDFVALAHRDRALVRSLVMMVLRRLGTLRHLLRQWVKFPASAPRVETALLLGAAQILWLDVADHAAVDLAVRLVQAEHHAARYAGLVNAVLRRVTREGKNFIAGLDTTTLDTPQWLLARWEKTYGAETAHAIATANAQEPALDLTVKNDPDYWADALGGRVLASGSVRAIVHGPIAQLPGYAEGAWWVQDTAAALPAKLLGDLHGLAVADLCAAPGGKTAQLALAGARVTAVDRAPERLERLRSNLTRLRLSAETVAADATQWQAGPFDAVLLDAPCSSTGTIRRHPDIPWLKRPADIAALAALQQRLVAHAVQLTKPGGILVYCSCSLEPEEGIEIVRDLLDRTRGLVRRPISADEVYGRSEWI